MTEPLIRKPAAERANRKQNIRNRLVSEHFPPPPFALPQPSSSLPQIQGRRPALCDDLWPSWWKKKKSGYQRKRRVSLELLTSVKWLAELQTSSMRPSSMPQTSQPAPDFSIKFTWRPPARQPARRSIIISQTATGGRWAGGVHSALGDTVWESASRDVWLFFERNEQR